MQLNSADFRKKSKWLDADRLTELDLTVTEVGAAIRAANIETTGGRLETEREELVIRGRFRG